MKREYTVIEFRKNMIGLRECKLKIYRHGANNLLNLRGSRLFIHPPIVYDLIHNNISIGIAPFVITTDNNSSLMLYSIGLEETQDNTNIIQYNDYYNIHLLDNSSLLLVDPIIDKAMKIINISMDKGNISYIDLSNLNIYTKTVHPLGDYIAYLSNNGTIYKLSLENLQPKTELLYQCNVHSIGRFYEYNLTLCQHRSRLHAFLSNKVYGTYIEINENTNIVNNDVYGYMVNNLWFINIGNIGYVARLGEKIPLTSISNIKPLAILDNDSILGISSNNLLSVYTNNKNNIDIDSVAKIDFHNMLDLSIDLQSYNVVLTYDDCIYLFNLLDNPKYVRLKVNNTQTAIPINDLLIIFRKHCIDIYRVDISARRIYVEGLLSIPRYYTRCVSLGKKKVMCIDKFDRIVIGGVEDFFLNSNYNFVILRDTTGITGYIDNYFMSLALDNIVNTNVIRRLSNNNYLVTLDFIDILKSMSSNMSMIHRLKDRVLTSIPNTKNVYILMVDKETKIISKDNNIKEYSYLATIAGSSTIKKNISLSQINNIIPNEPINNNTRVYLAREQGIIELGIAVEKQNIITINADDVLTTNNKAVCLSKNMIDRLQDIAKSLIMTAICSNTILRNEDICIDLTLCERILKLILEINTELSNTYITLPINILAVPKNYYIDDDKISIAYDKVVPLITLPKNCIEIYNTQLYLEADTRISIDLVNRCRYIGATIIIRSIPLFLEPRKKKHIEINIDLNDIISDIGIPIVVYETTGIILTYFIKIPLQKLIAKTYSIALKIAKVLGIKDAYKIHSYVYEDF